MHGTPASRSTTTMAERAHYQESLSPSQLASQLSEDASDTSSELPMATPPRKKSRNTASEVIELMLANNKHHRIKDDKHRTASLKVQKDLVDISLKLVGSMSSDINEMKTRLDTLQSTMLVSLDQITSLLTAQTNSTSSGSSGTSAAGRVASIPEEPLTPRAQRAVSVSSSTDNTTTPTRRGGYVCHSTQAASQTRTGPYNSH